MEVVQNMNFSKKVRGRKKGCRFRWNGTVGCRARRWALLESRSSQMPDQKTTAWLRRIQVPVAPGTHHSLVNCIEISNFCQVKNTDPKLFPVEFLPKMDHEPAQKVNRAALHFLDQFLTIFGSILDHFLVKVWTHFWSNCLQFLGPISRQIGVGFLARRPAGQNVPGDEKIRP